MNPTTSLSSSKFTYSTFLGKTILSLLILATFEAFSINSYSIQTIFVKFYLQSRSIGFDKPYIISCAFDDNNLRIILILLKFSCNLTLTPILNSIELGIFNIKSFYLYY